MKRACLASIVAAILVLAGCSDVLEVPREDQEVSPQMGLGVDSRLAALGVSRQVKQSRLRGGVRDSVNVIRCVVRIQQLNSRSSRSWKIALPVPADRRNADSKYRKFQYRGVPDGAQRATHTADCIVPNNRGAIRLAHELITGSEPGHDWPA